LPSWTARPEQLRPRTRKIVLEDYTLDVDIGFHDFEVGRPQRIVLTVEVWLDAASFPTDDDAARWNLRLSFATRSPHWPRPRRYNLQETWSKAITT
jgi:dihydroneopterin aldolase